MVFDSRAAETLQPRAALTLPDFPGLRLLATKSGKTWTYRYRGPDDCLRQIAIGPWPELTLADAIALGFGNGRGPRVVLERLRF